jgi:hypothetical protein
MAIRANAGGTSARLARRGHLSHGANHMAIPKASATALTAAVAATSSPGAGSGSVARPSTPAPAKNTAAKRPNRLRRSGGPSPSGTAPVWPARTGGRWAGPTPARPRGGPTAVVSARRTSPGRAAAPRCQGVQPTAPSPSRRDPACLKEQLSTPGLPVSTAATRTPLTTAGKAGAVPHRPTAQTGGAPAQWWICPGRRPADLPVPGG